MSIEAIGSRRVSETLRAVAKYLDDGARIAEGIPPGQAVKLQLEPASTTPGPQLSDVVWEESNSPIIERRPGKHTLHVIVSGENLQDVEIFKLIDARSVLTYSDALITDKKTKQLKAQFTLAHSSAVTYHAYIITKSGQTNLSREMLTVTVPDDLIKEPGLQLGELAPNVYYDNKDQEALLIVSRGDPSTFVITDTHNIPQEDWSVAKGRRNKIQMQDRPLQRLDAERMLKIDPPGQILTLKLKIPKLDFGGEHRVFYLRATDGSGAEDKLAFFVAAG